MMRINIYVDVICKAAFESLFLLAFETERLRSSFEYVTAIERTL